MSPHKKPFEKELFARTALGIKPGLEKISSLLDSLGNPHQRLAVIHVAGTNGKGSVCAILESVLRASGFKTALYTSPHLLSFSERFRVNGKTISSKKLEKYIEEIEATDKTLPDRSATFFEISTALAFQYFADEQVDIAIIETGMGGRWDATNVVIPLLSIITRIDLDHANYLGDSLEKVAYEKAGIIKSGRPVISAPQHDLVQSVLQAEGELILKSEELVSIVKIAAPQKLKIETSSQDLPPINLPLFGACQRENAAVAIAGLDLLASMLEFEPAYKKGLETVEWGSRFELLQPTPPIIIDGAHNPAAAQSLIQTLKELYPKHQIGFVLGFLGDKDVSSFLKILNPQSEIAWFVPLDEARAIDPDLLLAQAKSIGFHATSIEPADAWAVANQWLNQEPNRLLCITGSLYLKSLFSVQ